MKKFDFNSENMPDLPKMETGFKVPDGYFESFGERLQLRLATEKRSSRSKGIIFYLKPALGIAAGLAIIVTVYLHYPANLNAVSKTTISMNDSLQQADQSEQIFSAVTSLSSDGQLIAAMSEMDEYNASKMPKEDLADYLASNCSDFEILNANK
ncbi:MAG TPA: hypothetical protein VIK10_11755 [Prolixibacteraceae bacterium]